MKELVIATRNKKKQLEIQRLLNDFDIKVFSLDKFKGLPEVEEDGLTFRANARKKALETSSRLDKLVMADDSGLEVPALGNKPGVNSARYAGISQDDNKNNAKLLKSMKDFSGRKRRARFRCVICISKGRKVIGIAEGKVEGEIAFKLAGNTGFGYDVLFVPKGYKKTFAQLGPKIKDGLSHRAFALKKAKGIICKYFLRKSM
ncbi:MAG: RdgB/HAM1 family non-canonical purine NTP pyrophosphatase [Candidatus Omnitrophota bacterium]